jgi:hypothetical protein
MVLFIVNSILIFAGHYQAVRGTSECAYSAITAQCHINVVYVRAQFDRRAVRREFIGLILPALFKLDSDAFCGTNSCALAATGAILDFIEKARS